MKYTFDFDWGESWIVTENDFKWDHDYWYKVVARHIHFFRLKVRDVKPVDLITSVMISRDGEYKGLVSVSDNYVHVIMKDPDNERCWMVAAL